MNTCIPIHPPSFFRQFNEEKWNIALEKFNETQMPTTVGTYIHKSTITVAFVARILNDTMKITATLKYPGFAIKFAEYGLHVMSGDAVNVHFLHSESVCV